jgi:hypothetical protein
MIVSGSRRILQRAMTNAGKMPVSLEALSFIKLTRPVVLFEDHTALGNRYSITVDGGSSVIDTWCSDA